MPKKIIIVRHGETDYNVERRLQGWTDVPLNNNGIEQAKKVAERLKEELVSAIYSSDHQRALKTAEHIGYYHNLKPIDRPELREDRMGILEGWQWEKDPDPIRQKLWAERMHAREIGDIHYKIEGGESNIEHTARVKKFLDYIETNHSTDSVIVVSHGGTINRVMEIFGFKDITSDYVSYKNTSVTILTKSAIGYELKLHNDISHL